MPEPMLRQLHFPICPWSFFHYKLNPRSGRYPWQKRLHQAEVVSEEEWICAKLLMQACYSEPIRDHAMNNQDRNVRNREMYRISPKFRNQCLARRKRYYARLKTARLSLLSNERGNI